MATFELRTPMPVAADELSRWLSRPSTAERLSPPWTKSGGVPPRIETRIEGSPTGASVLIERTDAGEPALRYRHATALADLSRHGPPLSVAIGGSSGLMGTALTAFLLSGGNEVRRLPRGAIDPASLDGVDAVVNLGGAGIADARWSEERKRSIVESRVETTERLVEAMRRTTRRPRVFLSASAVGYYGDRGAELVDEDAGPGEGFLAGVCVAWERAALAAAGLGARTVLLRTGVVLTARGGALAKMLPAFRAGLGGPVGGGRQGLSWISHDDAVYAMHHLMRRAVEGPVNLVSPHPLAQADFAKALGRALGRPAVLPLPGFAVKLLFGRMGEEVLLSGCRALPTRLERSGFRFELPDLPAALSRTLGKGV